MSHRILWKLKNHITSVSILVLVLFIIYIDNTHFKFCIKWLWEHQIIHTFMSFRVDGPGLEGVRKAVKALTLPPSAPPPMPMTPWTQVQRRGAPHPTYPHPPPMMVRQGTRGHWRTHRHPTTTGRVCHPPSVTCLPHRCSGKLASGLSLFTFVWNTTWSVLKFTLFESKIWLWVNFYLYNCSQLIEF